MIKRLFLLLFSLILISFISNPSKAVVTGAENHLENSKIVLSQVTSVPVLTVQNPEKPINPPNIVKEHKSVDPRQPKPVLKPVTVTIPPAPKANPSFGWVSGRVTTNPPCATDVYDPENSYAGWCPGQPLQAEIAVYNADGTEQILKTTAAADGSFKITLTAGNYFIVFTKVGSGAPCDGQGSSSQSVLVIGGQTTEVRIFIGIGDEGFPHACDNF